MKKKILSSLLVAAMAATMLAGCGGTTTETGSTGDNGSTGSTETTSTSTGDTTAASGDLTNINVMRCCFNLATPDQAQVKKVEDAINAYIGDKIGVQISLQDIGSGEYTEKANLAIANNEVNLVWTASWEGTIGTNDLVPANAVYDLTNLLPGTDLYNSMDAGQWEATKYDGKNYFIPVYKDNVEGYDLMIRQALVDEYNIDVTKIKTISDVKPDL